ncbi:MAG: hypothetical protein JNL72_04485 [Flavipsychrobacter sp.]|nr:hypothetical protein [Flavipsychrobacter sp.]
MKVTKGFELKIDNPCAENFDAMPRTNCGMFCGKCQREVVDFTNLTDVELIDILKRKPDTCGLYRGDQLNKFYQYDEVKPERRPVRFWMGVLTFISLLGFKQADAQVKSKPGQHQEGSKSKAIPNNARVYCKAVDVDGHPFKHLKITAGNEVVETDDHGLFDIANPFSDDTRMVSLVFEFNSNYEYHQLHAEAVKDVAVEFKLQWTAPLIGQNGTLVSAKDIQLIGGTRDITTLVATAGSGVVHSQRNDLRYAGGVRSGNTVTYLDGIMINGKIPDIEVPRKRNFFQRLFGKKAK